MTLDYTDRKDFMIEFLFSMLFIASANAHAVAGQLLNILAIDTVWQDRIFAKTRAAAATHSRVKVAPLVEQLDAMPLHAWESSLPSLDLCTQEVVRMSASFSNVRQNISNQAFPTPGTD